MAEIIKFYPANAAKNPDNVLEQALGRYEDVLVIGWLKDDGGMDARASKGLEMASDMIWLLEAFKFNLISGVYPYFRRLSRTNLSRSAFHGGKNTQNPT